MSPKFIATLSAIAVLSMGCGTAESHELRLTHPPMVFGEYTTHTTHTADFAGLEVESSIPGRRDVYDSNRFSDNVVFTNNKSTVSVTISNPTLQDLIAPQQVTVTFYDGPTGHELESLWLATDVIGAGESLTSSLTTTHKAESGSYYWSYQIEAAEGWEAAVEAYAAAQDASSDESDEDDDFGDEDDW